MSRTKQHSLHKERVSNTPITLKHAKLNKSNIIIINIPHDDSTEDTEELIINIDKKFIYKSDPEKSTEETVGIEID